MIIEHFKKTPIARAPDEIVNATNSFTDHTAYLNNNPGQHVNIYHFHNHPKPKLKYSDNQILQYHSEPNKVDLNFPGLKLVLAQYHAFLPEYSNCKIVRNIIPIYLEQYSPLQLKLDHIRVGFSPSNIIHKGHFDKGFQITKTILEKLKSAYPHKFDFDIMTGITPLECMERKRKCNVIIDEVVTDSYHKCALEGLSIGKITICSLSKDVESLIERYAPYSPLINIWHDQLEAYLEHLIHSNINDIYRLGTQCRLWMERYWKPEDIINEYIKIYEDIL